jgi:hypothetical protein
MRVSLKLPGMNDEIACNDDILRVREFTLDERMVSSPEGIASRVHHELVKRMRKEEPTLLRAVFVNE